MKKQFIYFVMLLIFSTSTLFAQGAKEEVKIPEEASKTVTVYSYDSFCGDWGPGPQVAKGFEEKTGIKVNYVADGDAVEMLTKLTLEKDNPQADVFLGATNDMAAKALNSNLFESYDSPILKDIPQELQFDSTKTLNPFDYGNFAFVYDSEKLAKEDIPTSLEDLTDPKYKNKIILIDPRTSSVGLGLLIWTREVFGDDYLNWWEQVKDNVLTITDGWSSAYGMFTEGEAPLVISYTTSPVYHVMWEESTRYQVALFDEGHSSTIETIALLKSSKNKAAAKQFIDYILNEAQETIATTNIMYPSNSTAKLPDAYQWAPKPDKSLTLEYHEIEANLDTWLDEWTQTMSK